MKMSSKSVVTFWMMVLSCMRFAISTEPDVRLFFLVGSDRHLPLLPHFLHHWTAVLGVSAAKIYPDVHTANFGESGERQIKEAQRILQDGGVPAANVRTWIGHFDSSARKKRFDQHMHSVLPKTTAYMRTRKRHNASVWVAIADIDEFPDLEGESLASRLNTLDRYGYNILAGVTVDRLALDGKLESRPSASLALESQYPLKCNMTAACEKCKAQKAVAYRVLGSTCLQWGDDKGGHHLYKFTGWKLVSARCPPIKSWVEIWHFKWWGRLEKYLEERQKHQGNGAAAAVGMLTTVENSRINTQQYCVPRSLEPENTISGALAPQRNDAFFDKERAMADEVLRYPPPCLLSASS